MKEHSENYFLSLCREIITQQLAGGAARAIFGRFEKLFTTETVTAEKILLIPDQIIRDTGASWAKVKYIKSLAQCVVSKIIHLNKLNELSDAEVIEELVKVKGIGPWTAEMFLIFTLGRKDVFSSGDLGLKKGLLKLYKLDQINKETADKITKIWKPYRSFGSITLWHSLTR